ncbi:hypothetical protein Q7P36_000086 [Cladosporium allicinum]
MPPTRQTHAANDPFTDAPLRHPTIAPPNLRAAASASASHHALRSNASTASSRSRQQQINLFAPAQPRKPTSRRATPAFEEDVLADEVEEDAEELDAALQRRQVRQARAVRHVSPESKLARAQQKARLEKEREEESEFVIRKADGTFWREIEGLEGCLSAHLQAEEMVEEAEVRAVDEAHSATVRHYFTTAPVTGTRANEKHERSFEDHYPAVASRVRQLVLSKLEHEKWRYEAVSSY